MKEYQFDTKKTQNIFNDDPPKGWGLRGDVFFWNLLRSVVWNKGIESADYLARIIDETYRRITGHSIREPGKYEEFDFVKLFSDVGYGMSKGSISRHWWIEKGMPILQERLEMYVGDCTYGKHKIAVVRADITKRSETVVVNPANVFLEPGGGVSGAIAKAAGGEFVRACSDVPKDGNGERCPVGGLRVTPAGNMKCRFIYNTVAPNCQRGVGVEGHGKLRSCYLSIFNKIHSEEIKSIALPSIGTGKLAYPIDDAAEVAAGVIVRACRVDPDLKVVICCADSKTVAAYKNRIAAAAGI